MLTSLCLEECAKESDERRPVQIMVPKLMYEHRGRLRGGCKKWIAEKDKMDGVASKGIYSWDNLLSSVERKQLTIVRQLNGISIARYSISFLWSL